MRNNYDSILKEPNKSQPKIFKISNENANKPDYVLISIGVTFIILIISYIVYFNTVLDGQNIFLNDLQTISNDYQNIVKNLAFNYDIQNQYNFSGQISINNDNKISQIDYNINNLGNKLMSNFQNGKIIVNYYTDSINNYIQANEVVDNYIKSAEPTIYDYINLYSNFIKNLSSYLENKNNYKKSVYLENEKPVVKIETTLNKEQINNIINNSKFYLTDDYYLNITLVNDAISNKISSVKVILTNKTKNVRDVYQYNNQEIIHTNDQGINEKINIINDDGNFTLKYYQNDILFSVLTGTFDSNKYKYLYQVIDNKYNIKLTVDNNGNEYNYLFDINIDTNDKKYNIDANITGKYSNTAIIENTEFISIDKAKLDFNQLSRYNNIINNLLGFNLKDILN